MIIVQSAVLCVAGFVLLLQGDAIQKPFCGLTLSGRTCFAINIGCYMYLLVQDAVLQRHLTNYYITFTHHLVAAVVYVVFLEYRQNALVGAAGLLFAGATPFFEMTDFLKELHVEEHHKLYGVSCALSGISILVLRLLLPLGCIVYSFTVTSPFTMDILVLACYFLSVVFFGMLNLWFVYSAATSLRANYRARSAWTYMRPLRTGKPHGLDLGISRKTGQVRFTAKRNDLNFLAPCSNTNLAPTNLRANQANINKEYHKMNITAFLNAFGTDNISSDSVSTLTASSFNSTDLGIDHNAPSHVSIPISEASQATVLTREMSCDEASTEEPKEPSLVSTD